MPARLSGTPLRQEQRLGLELRLRRPEIDSRVWQWFRCNAGWSPSPQGRRGALPLPCSIRDRSQQTYLPARDADAIPRASQPLVAAPIAPPIPEKVGVAIAGALRSCAVPRL